MDKIIVSVAGSGTRFLSDRLGIRGNIHSAAHWDTLIEQVNGKKIYTPLRDPYKVWLSWCKRWRKAKESVPVEQFFASWFNLHALSLIYNIDFVNIEAQDDPRITNWTPIGKTEPCECTVPPIRLGPIYGLPFVKSSFSWSSSSALLRGAVSD